MRVSRSYILKLVFFSVSQSTQEGKRNIHTPTRVYFHIYTLNWPIDNSGTSLTQHGEGGKGVTTYWTINVSSLCLYITFFFSLSETPIIPSEMTLLLNFTQDFFFVLSKYRTIRTVSFILSQMFLNLHTSLVPHKSLVRSSNHVRLVSPCTYLSSSTRILKSVPDIVFHK